MFTLNCKGRLLTIDTPVVMGILNATPDSFYAGSRAVSVDAAVHAAMQMLSEGATLIDVGGQSTRPGATVLTAAEEMDRVLPVITAIRRSAPDCFISIDTYHAIVAAEAVRAGADVVNDISGGSFDPDMLSTVAALRVPYVCMHVKGTVQTMHKDPVYEDVTAEVLDYFIKRIAACKKAGITDVIVDPGFGFSKNSTHNFELLKNLDVFAILQKPLLLGISRKSTIYKTLGTTPEEALNGTTVLNTAGLLKGASILRVHDVRAAVEAIKLVAHLR